MKKDILILSCMIIFNTFASELYKCTSIKDNQRQEIILDKKVNEIFLRDISGVHIYQCNENISGEYCCNGLENLETSCHLKYNYTKNKNKHTLLEVDQDGKSLIFNCID